MTTKAATESKFTKEKLKAILEKLSSDNQDATALTDLLSQAVAAFKNYYSSLGKQQFDPKYFLDGDTARSDFYNSNMSEIDADISRFYNEVKSLAEAQLKSFNYAKIVNEELLLRADKLSSTVLDLKILSDFTRGDVLIAGDDFRTLDLVDTTTSTASSKAEKMLGAGGMALKRIQNRNLLELPVEIEVFPVQPLDNNAVNTDPTPGNIERFYEGNYYSFVGQARPEGGKFNIKYLLKPVKDDPKESKNGNVLKSVKADPKVSKTVNGNVTTTVIDDSSSYSNKNAGYFVELGASKETKALNRYKMLDSDPSTFWECEYVYSVPQPLLGDIIDQSSVENLEENEGKGQEDNLAKGATVIIDYEQAEKTAKQYDYDGRDLVVDLLITFPEKVPINYVVIDPILFGAQAFIEVLDVSTASEDDSQFITVEGWRDVNYAKTITPEANEYLNDVQIGQLLAPSRYEYTGKGVFPFPVRIASKIKIRLKVDNAVAAVYERYYTLLRNQLDISTEVKTTTTRGFLR